MTAGTKDFDRIPLQAFRVEPGTRVDLNDWSTSPPSGATPPDKSQGREQVLWLSERLSTLQELLYAGHQHKLLLILQGMDTSGKNSTVRHVFKFVDPLGVRVASFKAPTEGELDRDFLWRVHCQVPAKGEVVIFDRSHYEDVGIVRVHGQISPETCVRRFAHIRDFERLLVEEGTTILKFFLHLSRERQHKRLDRRRERPDKRWKFDPADTTESERWDDYMEAYSEAIAATSAPSAPWYIIPADKKWYRNLVVAQAVVQTLESLEMRYPER